MPAARIRSIIPGTFNLNFVWTQKTPKNDSDFNRFAVSSRFYYKNESHLIFFWFLVCQ